MNKKKKGLITTETAQNDPILFNKRLDCFSETTGQIASHRGNISRGENFDLQLHLKPKSHPLHLPPKDQDITGT